MSATPQTQRSTSGWLTFSAILFTVAGIGNIIWGLYAHSHKQSFYPGGLIWTSLNTWGWIAIIWE